MSTRASRAGTGDGSDSYFDDDGDDDDGDEDDDEDDNDSKADDYDGGDGDNKSLHVQQQRCTYRVPVDKASCRIAGSVAMLCIY